jgi:NADPH-dependent curcumin reductase CurA
VPIGGTMEAGGVGEVVASNHAGFVPGDKVFGMTGWASHAALPGGALRKLPDGIVPSTALGVLGMPGFTGWYGLNRIGQPKAGETLVVAAATGPVGSMVGQLAKRAGLRAVGVAGGAEKCKLAVDRFGFDACIDHRSPTMADDLKAATPDGIDIYFENVGGAVLEAVMPRMNPHGRIPLCGMIAWYNEVLPGALSLPQVWRSVLVKFLKVQGFIIMNHWDLLPEFLSEVAPLVASGDVAYLEDVAHGLEAAPEAFIGLLKGRNLGKQIVQFG